jgi:Cu(I)/Ag(I) efflux system membrane fusion protein
VKRSLSLTLIAAALLAAVAGGYWAGSRQAPTGDQPSVAAEAGKEGSGERKILYYRNPMGLPDTSPEPKKDSMGMDYIAVYEGDEPDDSGAVKVSPARLQTLGVKTAIAEETLLDAAVRAVGRIEVNERAIAEVAPKFEGWIEKLYVNATGDPVKRGQPLFSVYSPELVSAQKELAIAQALKLDTPDADPAARDSALRLAEAARERLRNWGVATADGKVAQRLTFSSPVNGVVLEKKAVEGMRFAPGMSIFRIADLSTVWVIADIYEQDLARVKVGQQAEVALEAFPERTFQAKVTYLYPTLNAATRTTQVRLELANRDGLLRPGMFAHVDLALGGATPRLSVPTSAVIDSGDRQVVLLVMGEGKYKPQPVKLGLRGRDRVEIREGLNAGDQVVVAANFLIDAESNLKAALATFTEPGAAAAKTYEATGSIEAIDLAGQSVSMNHEPIADLQWPAMTMDFGLAKPEMVSGILPGQPVKFVFEDRGNGEFVITRIDKTDGQAPAAPAAHQGH